MRTLSQLNEDKYVMVDKDWFDNKNYIKKYSHHALAIYSYILRGITQRGDLYFSVENIMSYLGINHYNKRSRDNVINILNSFKDDKIFEFAEIKPNTLIIANNLKDMQSYIKLYDFEIDTILNCKESINNEKLLTVFLYIKGCINYLDNYCFPQIETIKEKTNINSDASVVKYITALKDLGLILYDNAGLRKFKDGSMKYSENTYVMNYEGHDIILNDYIVKKQLELADELSKKQKKLEANARRSISMTKYHMTKNKS